MGLMLYSNQRSLDHKRLARFVKKEGLVADLGSHHKPLKDLLLATEKNLRLAQLLSRRPSESYKTYRLIAETARFFNPTLSELFAEDLAKLIESKANKYEIDPLLMTALISQESAFYENAKSPVGAYGYGQLMPGTAKFLDVDSKIPDENLEGCAKYLSQQLKTWKGARKPISFALASYNAGPGAVSKYNGVPPYNETRNYVHIIGERYRTLQKTARARGAGREHFRY